MPSLPWGFWVDLRKGSKNKMKKHNSNYEGKSFSIEVTNNGYLLKNSNMSITGWTSHHSNTFEELTQKLSEVLGLTDIGEKVNLSSSKDKLNLSSSNPLPKGSNEV
jgi:hypothetical protein